jgi:hypothetical protein
VQSSNEASGGGTGLNAPPFMVPANGAAGNGAPKPRVRARRGQATDPHSIAERVREPFVSLSETQNSASILGLSSERSNSVLCWSCVWQLRREKISDRMKNLQELVPNSNRVLYSIAHAVLFLVK